MKKKTEIQSEKLLPGWTVQTGVRLRCDGCFKTQLFEDRIYWAFAGEKKKKTTAYCHNCAKKKEIIL